MLAKNQSAELQKFAMKQLLYDMQNVSIAALYIYITLGFPNCYWQNAEGKGQNDKFLMYAHHTW
jgi:hypothetical protein